MFAGGRKYFVADVCLFVVKGILKLIRGLE